MTTISWPYLDPYPEDLPSQTDFLDDPTASLREVTSPMTPTIGRIIHIRYRDPRVPICVAAIITGNIRELYSATANPAGEPEAWSFTATMFSPNGPIGEAARRINVFTDTSWHYIRDCPG